MIRVYCYCKTGMLFRKHHDTFIVKDPEKIEFWKSMALQGVVIRIKEIKKKNEL